MSRRENVVKCSIENIRKFLLMYTNHEILHRSRQWSSAFGIETQLAGPLLFPEQGIRSSLSGVEPEICILTTFQTVGKRPHSRD